MEIPQASGPQTWFAPAGRASPDAVSRQMNAFLNNHVARAILGSLGGYVLVLNEQRQILAVNPALMESLEHEGHGNIVGRRWGEVVECVHSHEGPDGCGTSKACACCGAAVTMLAAQTGSGPTESECRMSLRLDGKWLAKEFQARSSLLDLACGRLLLVVFRDISDRKRREMLESALLHDLANTSTVLSGWSRLLDESLSTNEAAHRLVELSSRLQEFVHEQRILLKAETGKLVPNRSDLDVVGFLQALAEGLRALPACGDRKVEIALDPVSSTTVETDATLLFRILLNMGVNALEAVEPGTTITLEFERDQDRPLFRVRNPGVIPERIALQIFHRSFSTKSSNGRGIGTYSMKLFGENYLHGEVGFCSNPEEGTIFFIRLP